MSKETTCCFTGHRVLKDDFNTENLKNTIYKMIENGVDTFIAGGALGFDTQAAIEVLRAKRDFPNIKLFIFAPCKNQSAKWNFRSTMLYEQILKSADYVDMPSYTYRDGCMKERNYKMVDSSAFCICYYDGAFSSGTAQTVRYAKSKGLKIVNIYE